MDTSDVNVSPLILVIKSISISFVVQSASGASVFYIQSTADVEKVSEMPLNQWKITHLIPMHPCFSFLLFLLVSFLKESLAKGFEKFSVNCRSQICWAKNPDPRGEEPFQLKKAKQTFLTFVIKLIPCRTRKTSLASIIVNQFWMILCARLMLMLFNVYSSI